MGAERPRDATMRAPTNTRVEEPNVLQVMTASQTYPRAAGPPVLAKLRLALFDAPRASRDRRPSLTARLARSQQGPLVRLLVRGLARGVGNAARLERQINSERPRLVHCLSGTAALSLLASWERGAAPRPLVISVTGTDLGRAVTSPWWAPRLRSAFRAASAVIVDGSGCADELRRLGCAEEKVNVLRAPVDLDAMRAEGPRTDDERVLDPRLHVLFCGPFVERQGISFALEAAGRLARQSRGVFLRLMGTGPMLRPAQSLVEHLGLQDHVQFLGYGDTRTLAALLRRSDVLVCPSVTASDGDRETGAPPAVLLAMAAAVPVVATRHADIPEDVLDSRTGFLAEERDVESLTTALARVRNDAEFARSLGLAGRALVEKEHDARKVHARLEEIYLSVLGVRSA